MAKEIRRKLTTILAADVVGYSRLMATDDEASLERLKAYREVIDHLIARHSGRIFNTAGDAVLAEFISAVEAVRCAIAIQEELAARNSLLPEELRMALRIGVNMGDVISGSPTHEARCHSPRSRHTRRRTACGRARSRPW